VWDRLGADAFLLHHAALAYVNAHSTDGLVPCGKAKTLHSAVRAAAKQIRNLVDEKVWTECEGDCYRVCDVQDDLRVGGGRGDEQPSAAYVEAENERARVRKERWKQKQEHGKNPSRNGVPTDVRSRTRDSAVQDRAVQDSYESSPAPKLAAVVIEDDDCEHGIDRHSSCRLCAAVDREESA